MASVTDLRELEDLCPWEREDFQADLALLAGGTAAASRMYAADLRVIARLAAQVPRCPFDESGATPWTSFRREIAVARRVSDRAAAQLIRCALRLTAVLPQAMALLEDGSLTVPRAIAFVTALEGVQDELASQVDLDLAQPITLLPVWRIEQEVRRAVLRRDPDAAAQRTADKNATRGLQLYPDADDQAMVCVTGPAVPLTRWYATVDARARALKAAGDPRPLDALRFDLATSSYPCDVHAPAGPTVDPTEGKAESAGTADAGSAEAGTADAGTAEAGTAAPIPAGLRPSFVEAAPVDCRMSRPVQAKIALPVETSLGLSHEPGWLDGYGWISAPTCRLLLVDAELREVCVKAGTGELVDLPAGIHRPPPTPSGLRESLLAMVLGDVELSDIGWRTEPQHDPSERLREYVTVRDRSCDGPTGARVAAGVAQLDHDDPWPHGPTAAWNLVARGARTHQLKHRGWTPLRTPTSTVWLSPAGQVVEVPRHLTPAPGIDPDPAGEHPVLPDPADVALLDQLQLTATADGPPGLTSDLAVAEWTWLDGGEPPPF